MKSAVELKRNVGRRGLLSVDAMQFEVEIVDARERYGTIDYRIKPTNGTGGAWVSSGRVQVIEEARS